jgi:hypothetical protein
MNFAEKNIELCKSAAGKIDELKSEKNCESEIVPRNAARTNQFSTGHCEIRDEKLGGRCQEKYRST